MNGVYLIKKIGRGDAYYPLRHVLIGKKIGTLGTFERTGRGWVGCVWEFGNQMITHYFWRAVLEPSKGTPSDAPKELC